jgi:gamma-glutamyltranspeptidase/glutathione hydrolase
LLSQEFLKQRWNDFSFDAATDSKKVSGGAIAGYESMETTHSSFADKEGNAVSITTTLNNSYGSKVVVAGGGFYLMMKWTIFLSNRDTPIRMVW